MTISSSMFGSEQEFRSLVCIHRQYLFLDRKDQKYLSSLLSDLNRILTKIGKVEDSELFNYLILGVRKDFIDKNNAFYNRIKDCYFQDLDALHTHIQNFIIAKIRKVINEKSIK